MNKNSEKLFFYDLETTGLNPARHGVHQISGIITINGEVKEKIDLKVRPNPKAAIEQPALDVGNVTREQILAYPKMDVVFSELTAILSKYVDKFNKQDKLHLVGYNIMGFDNDFFRGFWIQNGDKYFGSMFWSDSIDVMALASNEFRDSRSEMVNFKLATVAEKCGIHVDETKLHDASYDIYLTMEIFKFVNI